VSQPLKAKNFLLSKPAYKATPALDNCG